MKGILKARGRANALPGDPLTRDALDFDFYGQSGLPSTADSIAYDPVQKLLAVQGIPASAIACLCECNAGII